MKKDRDWYERIFSPSRWPLQGYHKIAASWSEGSVLDIGSDNGRIKELIPDAVCLDFSRPAIKWTKGINADAYNLPLKDSCFDTILLLEILEHLKTPSSAFSEAIRVSRNLIIISIPEKGEHLSVSHAYDIPLTEWVKMLNHDLVELEETKTHDHRHITRWRKKTTQRVGDLYHA